MRQAKRPEKFLPFCCHIKDGIIGQIEDNREHHASVFGTSTIMK